MISRFQLQAELRKLLTMEWLLQAASVFILATLFLAWDASRVVYVLLSLFALVYLIRFRPRLPRDQRLYSWPILVFVGATFVSLMYHGFPDSGVNILVSRYFLLLLAIPLVSLFFAGFDSGRNPWTGFIIANLVLAILAMVDILLRDVYLASAGHNSAVFGAVTLAMTSCLLASYHWLRKMKYGTVYYLLGILSGACAMLLSGNRSSWIVALVIIFIAIIFYLDRFKLWKRVVISIIVICCITLLSLSVPLVQKRAEVIGDMVAPYLKGEHQTEYNSLRYRVEAWKVAWNLGMTNKAFGIGPGDLKKSLKAYVKERGDLTALAHLNHAHNQYMQTLAISGMTGLVALVVLIISHLWLFSKYLKKQYSVEVRSFAFAGFLLVIVYLIYGVPAVPFYSKQLLMMYGFASASLWGCLLGALQNSLSAPQQ